LKSWYSFEACKIPKVLSELPVVKSLDPQTNTTSLPAGNKDELRDLTCTTYFVETHVGTTSGFAWEAKMKFYDIFSKSYDSIKEKYRETLIAELPSLPPSENHPKIEVTQRVFTVWDSIHVWSITSVTFLRADDGKFTIWTPGLCEVWEWRGPLTMLKKSAELLSIWLTQGESGVLVRGNEKNEPNIKISIDQLWIGDPDPNILFELGFLKLSDGGFELSVMGGGLRRGGAFMGIEDGQYLARWLSQVKS
jgi:hypothetical protein